MTEMVDRVAQRLYEVSVFERTPWLPLKWEEVGTPTRSMYHKYARAAILGMRTPTVGMIDAANSVLWYGRPNEMGPDPAVMWPTMIDAALHDEREKHLEGSMRAAISAQKKALERAHLSIVSDSAGEGEV